MQEAKIKIEGMTCGGCTASVTRVLEALPGVGFVDVSLERNEAAVRFDPAHTDLTTLKRTIEAAGYRVP
ncbi:MAG: heavy-metal-associated domain-containing protein [Betaproteobacteria bacterium]